MIERRIATGRKIDMKKNKKIKPLNRELVRYFALIVGSIGVLFLAMMFSIAAISRMNTAINRDIRYMEQLYDAETAHYKWADSLMLSISDGREFTGSLDWTKCGFGQFIYNEENHNDADMAALINAVEPIHKNIHAAAEKILTAAESDKEAGMSAYETDIEPEVGQLTNVIDAELDRIQKQMEGRQTILLLIVVIGGLICVIEVVLTVFCIYRLFRFLRREISEKLTRISGETGKLADGQLDIDIRVDGQVTEILNLQKSLNTAAGELTKYVHAIDIGMGEFARGNLAAESNVEFIGDFTAIQTSIDAFAGKISGVISNVGEAAVSVAESSEQISMAVQELAESAQNQSESVQTLAEHSDHVNNMIGRIVEEMRDVRTLIARAGETVQDEKERMAEVTQSMEQIKNHSEQIREIIGTIEDIVKQTKLLALNASIEAARAGEFGKGFAVVADEVTKLADQSAEASMNIAELIMDTMEVVKEGDQKVCDAAGHLENIVGVTEDITEKVENVFVSTEEESEAMSQIKNNIDSISQEILTNSAASEQNSASSQELASQAQLLKSLTEQFELRNSR